MCGLPRILRPRCRSIGEREGNDVVTTLVVELGIAASGLKTIAEAPIERHRGPYYVRLMVTDRPGVIADVTAVFRDEQVSIESMIQRARSETEAVPVVLNMHECEEAAMQRALSRIAELDSVVEAPTMIRIESLA